MYHQYRVVIGQRWLSTKIGSQINWGIHSGPLAVRAGTLPCQVAEFVRACSSEILAGLLARRLRVASCLAFILLRAGSSFSY